MAAHSQQRAIRRLTTACMAALLFVSATALGQPEASWRGKPVAHWIGQLADDDRQARWYATYALGQIGPAAAAAVEPLADMLADRAQYEYVRGGAAWAIGRIGIIADADRIEPQKIVRLLIKTLRSDHISVRRNAPAALGNIGQPALSAVEPLIELLEDDDPQVRVNAAVALWKISQHPDGVAALVEMTRDADRSGAFEAVNALGRIGLQSETAQGALLSALGHDDADVRRAAARAVGRIGPSAIPRLKDALYGQDTEIQRNAAEALGWIGPKAVPALIVVLGADAPAVRRAAARALGRLGPAAKIAETALVETVGDGNRQVQEAAAWALKRIRATGSQ